MPKKKKKPRKKRTQTLKTKNTNSVSGDSILPAHPLSISNPMKLMEKLIDQHGAEHFMEDGKFSDVETVQAMMEDLENGSPSTPLEQAERLLEEAYDTQNMKERTRLARKALKVCPDCLPAHLLMADSALSPEEALRLYEKTVELGKQQLGEKYFTENSGHFWGLRETRPFMNALAGIAQALIALNRPSEALKYQEEMLRLNPNDNQGIRYGLLHRYISAGRLQEAEKLLKQYSDDCASSWYYGRALLEFALTGDSKRSRKALNEALKQNPYVVDYISGKRIIGDTLPDHHGIGDDSEALIYAATDALSWEDIPNALTWFFDNCSDHESDITHPEDGVQIAKKPDIDLDGLNIDELVELNNMVVRRIEDLEQFETQKIMMQFLRGERILVPKKNGGTFSAVVQKHNRKTITVVADNGRKYNIPPQILLKESSSDLQNEQPANLIEFKT